MNITYANNRDILTSWNLKFLVQVPILDKNLSQRPHKNVFVMNTLIIKKFPKAAALFPISSIFLSFWNSNSALKTEYAEMEIAQKM